VLAGTALRIPMAAWSYVDAVAGNGRRRAQEQPGERWRLGTICLLNALGSVMFTVAIRSGGVAIGNTLASTSRCSRSRWRSYS